MRLLDWKRSRRITDFRIIATASVMIDIVVGIRRRTTLKTTTT
jgi:hypothetical protein